MMITKTPKFETVSPEFRKHPSATVTLPRRQTAGSMAYDFYSPVSVTINPHESLLIWTDVRVRMSSGLGLVINVRSSMGLKGIRLVNTQGWIDADYYANPANDGNIGICLLNESAKPYVITEGDRIAQGMFLHYAVVEDDETNAIREGGFGSTNQ